MGVYCSAVTMEQPPAQILSRQPKSLKEIAYSKNVENIKSVAEFKKLLAQLPVDLHCDFVKKIIHNNNFTQQQVIEIINTYCHANPLLKAYTYYTRITLSNRKQNIMRLQALRQAAEYTGDRNAVSLIAEFIALASTPENNFTLLKILINRNDVNQIKQVISMGERPTIQDLHYAIALNRNSILEILINANAPLQNTHMFIIEQPLHVAFYRLNETAITTLLAHGVSLDNTYLIDANKRQKDTITNDIRTRMQNWNPARAFPGMTLEETAAYFKKVSELLDKYAPQPKGRRKSF